MAREASACDRATSIEKPYQKISVFAGDCNLRCAPAPVVASHRRLTNAESWSLHVVPTVPTAMPEAAVAPKAKPCA